MNEFNDTVGPVIIVGGIIVAAYWLYRLALHGYVATKTRLLEIERQAINNRIAEENSRLVTVTPQAALVARSHVESGVLYEPVFDLLRADVEVKRLPPPVPSSLHYAPHIIDRRPVAELPAAQIEEKPASVVVPTFANLMAEGAFRPGYLLFGVEAGNLLFDQWATVYHLAVSGKTRSGKTRTVASLATQMVWLNGAKLAILDPHGHVEGSLADLLSPLGACFLAEPAIEEKQIIDTIRFVQSIGDARLHKKASKEQPILLLVDEMTKLLNRMAIGQELAPLLEGAAQELAKVNVFLLCSGQSWKASRVGGDSALRASFASALVHRTDKDQAKMLIPVDMVRDAPTYAPGTGMFMDAAGDFHKVNVPLITRQDVELVAQTITRGGKAPHTVYALPQGVEDSSDHGSVDSSVDSSTGDFGDDTELSTEPWRIDPMIDSARMARVRKLMIEKKGVSEIINEVWGVDFNTRAGRQARTELLEIIAKIAQG